ncbi:MAG: EamA family transporter RarD [Neisseria sp.]|nr:EamA family transporter RarD [Neisseria sp.]
MTHDSANFKRGLYAVLLCYLIWGLFPLYWYPLNASPIAADQLIAQRITWTGIFCLFLLAFTQHKHEFFRIARQKKLAVLLSISAVCISINWLVYLWAINNYHVLDASLGYFINPLANVLLGRLVLKENLNRWQGLAIVFAIAGILWLAIPAGQIPWVALALAGSFSLYGLIRKIAPVGAAAGLAWESLILMPFSVGYLALCASQGNLVFGELNALQLTVLIGSGVATAVPLLLYATAARLIPLSTIGMLQYGSPTLQMLLGLMLFNERFDVNRFIGYAWVWLGVAVYVYGIYRQSKRT